MVATIVRIEDVRAAMEDDGHLFDEFDLFEDDGFDDDESLELQCAIDCLLQCGTSWKELCGRTIQAVLDQYRVFLQEDRF